MNSSKILNLLEKYQPENEAGLSCKNRMLSFISGNSNCFRSEHPPLRGQENVSDMGHVTGSAWILSPDRKAVLLTHHKKLNMWLQLGGHSDGEPDVLKTALREAHEESGILDIAPISENIFDIDIHIFPKKKNIEAHLHYDIRFCLQSSSYEFYVSDESNDLRWVPILEITGDQYDPSVRRMAQKTALLLNS